MAIVFKSFRKEVLSKLDEACEVALEIVGGMAESDVKKKITQNRSVVTGNLRNSITHEPMDSKTEVIGSNVEYAPYVELGHRTRGGGYVNPKPYLQPAIAGNAEKYKKVIQDVLSEIK